MSATPVTLKCRNQRRSVARLSDSGGKEMLLGYILAAELAQVAIYLGMRAHYRDRINRMGRENYVMRLMTDD